ncbi:MAG: cytochrome c3 family protein [bacterium]
MMISRCRMQNQQPSVANIIKRFKKLIPAALLIISGCFSAGAADDFIQPVEFSHKTHAGTNEIPCEFCHTYARRSINSGAPTIENCIGCHSVVSGTETDQKDKIKLVKEFWDNRKTIPWKKIHDLPDFVYFSHKRHIQVGFDCTECHGEINQLDVISMNTMIADLSMGWCTQCHTQNHPVIKGKVAGPVRKTRGGAIVPGVAMLTPDGSLLASKDCTVCHK